MASSKASSQEVSATFEQYYAEDADETFASDKFDDIADD